MPKCYSEGEREEIRRRLKEEAAVCIGQFGVRRTTVDELVKRVGIPKGTFYLFYRSKEQLLFAAIAEQQAVIEGELAQKLQAAGPSMTAGVLAEIIFELYQKARDLPALKGLRPSEIELLARKLPPEVLAEHFAQDDSGFAKLFQLLPAAKLAEPKAFSAAFRALFLASTHRQEIGAEAYDEALKLLINGLTLQMIE